MAKYAIGVSDVITDFTVMIVECDDLDEAKGFCQSHYDLGRDGESIELGWSEYDEQIVGMGVNIRDDTSYWVSKLDTDTIANILKSLIRLHKKN